MGDSTKTLRDPSEKPPLSLEYGREIIKLEADAVAKVGQLLTDDFLKAVRLILDLPGDGRVVVSGMGKAGFIAMKISATLASTGVPSFFLHPAEAIHGDLGRYSKHDVALILSNSGETAEVVGMLPYIKRMGCALISITGNPNSQLARHSDAVLSIGKTIEAGPLGLAPTTSTTAMLALGDALCMTVLSQQSFSQEQFAFYHPGGNLGRSLLLVSEIMRRGDELCLVTETTVGRDVLHRITTTPRRPGAAIVTDGDGKVCGVFTDGDLRRCLEYGTNFLELPIREVMGRTSKTITPDRLLQEALRIMSDHKIDEIIVVDGEKRPVGMVDVQDVVAVRTAQPVKNS